MKKSYITFVFLVVFALGLVGTATAQQRGLTSSEIVTITSLAERKLGSISYQTTLTTEWFTERDGELTSRDTYFFATVQPERYHWIMENAANKIETVVVDGRTFRRVKDADWESVAVSPAIKSGNAQTVARFGELNGGSFQPAGTGKFIARGTIDGLEVTQYETRNTLRDSTAKGKTRVDTTQYWIDNEGLIVRKIIEQDMPDDKRFMRSVSTYEYNDIKIVEPIIPTKAEDQ